MEGLDGVRDDGNEEREPCRPMLLLVVPLVEGRYESTEAIMAVYKRN